MAENPDQSSELLDASRRNLRRRWELASVLNFLHVFEPVIGKDLKMSGEEIETGLIAPNESLAKLHVKLLEGIPPVNKNLSKPDAWVTILCKKLAEWWPWVAEGDIPLTVAKGEEISKYKELDPTSRLLMLKALCELRTEQDDLVSYVNDMLEESTQLSHFRKDKIGEDMNGICYWYDSSSAIGHRLYREVKKFCLKPKHKGKGCSDAPTVVEWETLATNLNEFREVMEQLSSCKFGVETVVYKFLETEVIPVLEQLEKKKERALKRQQRQEALLNDFQSHAARITRSCRVRKPVSYTFDEFDRSINEALNQTRKRKDREVEKHDQKHHEGGKRENGVSADDSAKDNHSNEGSQASLDEDMENEQQGQGSDNYQDFNSSEAAVKNEVKNSVSDSSDSDIQNEKTGHHFQAKNHLRQRPSINTAIESAVEPPNSDNRSSPENESTDFSSGGDGDPSAVADSEGGISS